MSDGVYVLDPFHTFSELASISATTPQTITVGPVDARLKLPGARLGIPGEAIVGLHLTVTHRYGNLRVVLDQCKSPTWQDTLSEPGAGSLVLGNDDLDLDAITEAAIILFELWGTAVFTMLPRQLERATVPNTEEKGSLTTVTGPGHLAILEEAIVYPSRGPGVWPIEEDRLFSWAAADYDDRWWGETWAYADVMAWTPAWYGMQDGWPAGLPAKWIGAPGTTARFAPGGKCYIRAQFDVPETGSVGIWAAADDQATVYVDGQELFATDVWGNVPDDVKNEKLQMTSGVHNIAIEYDNGYGTIDYEGAPFNPAGIVVGIAMLNPDGSVKSPVEGSAAGWKILAYPDQPPGQTPGEVMLRCLAEAKGRGALWDITPTFDKRVDSGGYPWPIVGDIATKVGYDVLTFFRELAGTYVDIAMAPGCFDLYAWSLGGRGEYTGVELTTPTNPADPRTGNLLQLTHKRAL